MMRYKSRATISGDAAMMCQFKSDSDQLQAVTVPALTPAQASSLLIQPASITSFEVVLGDRVRGQQDGVHFDAVLPLVNLATPR